MGLKNLSIFEPSIQNLKVILSLTDWAWSFSSDLLRILKVWCRSFQPRNHVGEVCHEVSRCRMLNIVEPRDMALRKLK